MHRLLLASAVLLVSPLAAQVATVTIPCDLDNTLYEDPTGSLSNGQGTSIFVGVDATGLKRRALVHFPVLFVIPPTARVLSARLRLNVVASASSSPVTISAHSPLALWGEGGSVAPGAGGGGAPAQPGDATWLHTSYPSGFWSTPGGTFGATPSFTMTLPATGVAIAPASWEASRAVELWMTTSYSGPGWLLKMVDEVTVSTACRIDSSESTGLGPALIVTYVMPGTIGYFGAGCPTGSGSLALTIQGAPIGGSTLQLVQSGGPPLAIGASFFDIALEMPGVPLGAGCSVYLTPAFFPGALFTLDSQGAASTALPVPLGVFRAVVVSQSAVLAPTPFGIATSNAAFFVTQ